MGLYIQQNQSRSELQQRIAADLRAKAAARAKEEGTADPYVDDKDIVEDSEYLKGTKHTTSLAWVWLAIFIATIAVFVMFVIRSN